MLFYKVRGDKFKQFRQVFVVAVREISTACLGSACPAGQNGQNALKHPVSCGCPSAAIFLPLPLPLSLPASPAGPWHPCTHQQPQWHATPASFRGWLEWPNVCSGARATAPPPQPPHLSLRCAGVIPSSLPPFSYCSFRFWAFARSWSRWLPAATGECCGGGGRDRLCEGGSGGGPHSVGGIHKRPRTSSHAAGLRST